MGDYVKFAGTLGYTTPPSTSSIVTTGTGVSGTGTSTSTTTTGVGSGPVTITLDTKSPYEVPSAGRFASHYLRQDQVPLPVHYPTLITRSIIAGGTLVLTAATTTLPANACGLATYVWTATTNGGSCGTTCNSASPTFTGVLPSGTGTATYTVKMSNTCVQNLMAQATVRARSSFHPHSHVSNTLALGL